MIDELLVDVWEQQEQRFREFEYFSMFNYNISRTRIGKSKIIIDFSRFN